MKNVLRRALALVVALSMVASMGIVTPFAAEAPEAGYGESHIAAGDYFGYEADLGLEEEFETEPFEPFPEDPEEPEDLYVPEVYEPEYDEYEPEDETNEPYEPEDDDYNPEYEPEDDEYEPEYEEEDEYVYPSAAIIFPEDEDAEEYTSAASYNYTNEDEYIDEDNDEYEQEDASSALYIERGSNFALLAGVRAVDEHGDSLPVFVVDNDDFDIDAVYPYNEFFVLYGTDHPEIEDTVIRERWIIVVEGEPEYYVEIFFPEDEQEWEEGEEAIFFVSRDDLINIPGLGIPALGSEQDEAGVGELLADAVRAVTETVVRGGPVGVDLRTPAGPDTFWPEGLQLPEYGVEVPEDLELDLLYGVWAQDETEAEVEVFVVDDGGFNFDVEWPDNSFTVVYGALHPVTGEEFTRERTIVVVQSIVATADNMPIRVYNAVQLQNAISASLVANGWSRHNPRPIIIANDILLAANAVDPNSLNTAAIAVPGGVHFQLFGDGNVQITRNMPAAGHQMRHFNILNTAPLAPSTFILGGSPPPVAMWDAPAPPTIPTGGSITLNTMRNATISGGVVSGTVISPLSTQNQDGGGITVESSATSNMWGVNNLHFTGIAADPDHVHIIMNDGVTITGGRHNDNAGAVRIGTGVTFFLNGGQLVDNAANVDAGNEGDGGAFFLAGQARLYMSGGLIARNWRQGGANNVTTTTGGGGVFLNIDHHSANVNALVGAGPTFTMTGGIIENNWILQGQGGGGGVHVGAGATFDMHGGIIRNHFATGNNVGGGVLVRGSGVFNMHGGEISGNTSAQSGGGVWAGNGVGTGNNAGRFNMYGGRITDNTVGQTIIVNNPGAGPNNFITFPQAPGWSPASPTPPPVIVHSSPNTANGGGVFTNVGNHSNINIGQNGTYNNILFEGNLSEAFNRSPLRLVQGTQWGLDNRTNIRWPNWVNAPHVATTSVPGVAVHLINNWDVSATGLTPTTEISMVFMENVGYDYWMSGTNPIFNQEQIHQMAADTNSQVRVNAGFRPGYAFTHWIIQPATDLHPGYNLSQPEIAFTMPGGVGQAPVNRTLIAHWQPISAANDVTVGGPSWLTETEWETIDETFTLYVNASVPGATAFWDGPPIGAPSWLTWDPGTGRLYGTVPAWEADNHPGGQFTFTVRYQYVVPGAGPGGTDFIEHAYHEVTVQIIPRSHDLTIINNAGGTPSGLRVRGDSVTVTAGPETNRTFLGWESVGGITLANPSNPIQQFEMPDHDVTLTATWREHGRPGLSGPDNGGNVRRYVYENDLITETFTIDPNSYPASSWDTPFVGMPSWMTFDPITGVFSGTPPTNSAPNTHNIIVRASNSYGPSTLTFTVVVQYARRQLTVVNSPAGTVPGQTASGTHPRGTQITLNSGIRAGYTFTGWSVVPASIQIANANTMTAATFTMPADSDVTVTANWVRSEMPRVGNPLHADGGYATHLVNTPFSHDFNIVGSPEPSIAHSFMLGSMLDGLEFDDETGILSGVPTETGIFTIRITMTNLNSAGLLQTTYADFTLVVGQAPRLLNTNAPDNAVGTVYGPFTFTQSGAFPVAPSPYAPLTWSATGLPANLSIDPATGVLTSDGTVPLTATGTHTFTVTVSNVFGSDSERVTITLYRIPVITEYGPFTAQILANSTFTIRAVGYPTPNWEVVTDNLPSGLSFNPATGVISGRALVRGNFYIDVIARNDRGSDNARVLVIIPGPVTPPVINNPNPPRGVENVPGYSYTFTSNTPGVTWSYTGTLPPGLTLDPDTGALTGTPSQEGSHSFTIIATAPNGGTASRPVTVVVGPPLSINAPTWTGAQVGSSFSYTLRASGGVPPVGNWVVTAGSLPAGLSLNLDTGAITGTPTTAGTFGFTVAATDNSNITATRATSITVAAAPVVPPVITSPNPPNGTEEVPGYEHQFTSDRPGDWTSPNLPPWLTLDPDGRLHGDPPAGSEGDHTFTVVVTCPADGGRTEQQVIVRIGPPLRIVNPGPITAQVGSAITTVVINSTGGVRTTITWANPGGGLPSGLVLNQVGLVYHLTGIPAIGTIGSHSVTVSVTDASGRTVTETITINVVSAVPPVINNPNPPRGVEDMPYNYQLTSNNPDVIWSAPNPGDLPPGLTLNPDGSITGTPGPGSEGSYTFTVIATCPDTGASSSRDVTIVIGGPLSINDPGTIPPAPLLAVFNLQLTTSGGVPPITSWGWSAVGTGSLPPGLSITPAGVITGRPTQNGTFDVNVIAIDSSGATANRTLTIVTGTGVALPPVTNVTMTPARILANYEFRVSTVSDAPGPWVLSGGTSLPPGLTLSTVGGGTAITGRPTQRNTFNFQLTAADGVTTINFTLVVS